MDEKKESVAIVRNAEANKQTMQEQSLSIQDDYDNDESSHAIV
jgi:hypothetical protein